jgi:23S rRNA-/tRNA-specific pseudouridylate synthase
MPSADTNFLEIDNKLTQYGELPRFSFPLNKLQVNSQDVKEALHSTYYAFKIYPDSGHAPRNLYDWLRELSPELENNASWQDRAAFGGLHINGRRVISDRPIHTPAFVEYYDPKYDISLAESFYPKLSKDQIIYHDDHLAVVYKPAGIPTSSSREQAHYSLKQSLEKYFNCSIHTPSRLDTSTAGVVVVSLSSDMHGRIQRLYQRRLIDKTYLLTASLQEKILEENNLIDTIRKSPILIDATIGQSNIHPVLREVITDANSKNKSSRQAITVFTLKTINNNQILLEAKPITGRTHQIRVHSAAFFGPIDGDRFYGGNKTGDGLHLLSYGVAFQHPISSEHINITLPESLHPLWL